MQTVTAPPPSSPRRRARRGLAAVGVLAVALVLGACDASTQSPPAGSPAAPTAASASDDTVATPDPGEVAAAADAIARLDLADPASIAALDAMRLSAGAAEAAAKALADGATGDARWAATWVYAASGDDTAVLAPLLADADPSIRAMAAMTLLAAGERGAIPVLVELTGSDAQLAGSRPPVRIGRWAADALAAALDPAMDAPAAAPDAARTAWTAWLEVHRNGLAYDPSTGTWSTK